jgi:hypothetical protein
MRRNMVLLILKLVVAFIALGAFVVNLPFMPLLVPFRLPAVFNRQLQSSHGNFWCIFGVVLLCKLLVVRGGTVLGQMEHFRLGNLLLRWHIRDVNKVHCSPSG